MKKKKNKRHLFNTLKMEVVKYVPPPKQKPCEDMPAMPENPLECNLKFKEGGGISEEQLSDFIDNADKIEADPERPNVYHVTRGLITLKLVFKSE